MARSTSQEVLTQNFGHRPIFDTDPFWSLCFLQVADDASMLKRLLKSVGLPNLGELNSQIDKLTADCNK
jgi:DNA primase